LDRNGGAACKRKEWGTAAMSNTPERKSAVEKTASRHGRPRRELAGEVDVRILDAAYRLFLERGLAGASIDEIARLAPASKPTIYARFASKNELFTAVLLQKADALARVKSYRVAGATIDERLLSLVTVIMHAILAEDTVQVIRLAIAEAQRFPELAYTFQSVTRERWEEALLKLLAEVAYPDEGASAPLMSGDRERPARLFFSLFIAPLLLRALLGEELEAVRAEIGPHAASGAPVFLRACEGWGVIKGH
jgi:AcrR family transcriptional regulator